MIPSFPLNNGRTIPAIGYGAFQLAFEEVRRHHHRISLYCIVPDKAPALMSGPNGYSQQT